MKRAIVVCSVFLLLIVFEVWLGSSIEEEKKSRLKLTPENLAYQYYHQPDDFVPIPKKGNGVVRIVYISNSHARTGGHVAKHLQRFLSFAADGKFEVMDIADPGIFAPDMLQRVYVSESLDPDAVVLPVAYISFSDRMKLSLQAHTARSFFKDAVFSKLQLGFWIRNYDIDLYLNTLISSHVALYRYRNEIRDTVESIGQEKIAAILDGRQPIFLDTDENQSWKFPDGYDRNLFQWNLYASGRKGHLADLRDAVEFLKLKNIKLIGINLPIDWAKSAYPYDQQDYQLYQSELSDLFKEASLYSDLQSGFPVRFSTYDALHPGWQGARLHALSIVDQLKEVGVVSELEHRSVYKFFRESREPEYEAYNSSIEGWSEYEGEITGFRRFDLTEPHNAASLIRRLSLHKAGSREEGQLLAQLSYRARFLLDTDFAALSNNTQMSSLFKREIFADIDAAKKKVFIFKRVLGSMQSEKLEKDFPIPDMAGAQLLFYRTLTMRAEDVVENSYLVGDRLVRSYRTVSGEVFAYAVSPESDPQQGYMRVDVLGNQSFAQLSQDIRQLQLPEYIQFKEPRVPVGI